jgi:hypothetical protein
VLVTAGADVAQELTPQVVDAAQDMKKWCCLPQTEDAQETG